MDKINSVESDVEIDETEAGKGDKKRTSYVSRTHKSMIEFVATIYKSLGHGEYHSNKAIATVHKLSYTSIKPHLASSQQYKLLELKHGTGYKVTDLFTKIYLPVNEAEQRAAVIESLKYPETYQPLFKEYEFHIVPPVTGIKNHFVRKLQFKEEIAENAARVFIENLKDYNLLDERGVLTSGLTKAIPNNATPSPESKPQNQSDTAPQQNTTQAKANKGREDDDDLFELPIPLPNKRKAYLRYPIDNLTRKDIKVITKALEFIASSLDDEEES